MNTLALAIGWIVLAGIIVLALAILLVVIVWYVAQVADRLRSSRQGPEAEFYWRLNDGRLQKRVDDANGSVTGTPHAKYFEYPVYHDECQETPRGGN